MSYTRDRDSHVRGVGALASATPHAMRQAAAARQRRARWLAQRDRRLAQFAGLGADADLYGTRPITYPGYTAGPTRPPTQPYDPRRDFNQTVGSAAGPTSSGLASGPRPTYPQQIPTRRVPTGAGAVPGAALPGGGGGGASGTMPGGNIDPGYGVPYSPDGDGAQVIDAGTGGDLILGRFTQTQAAVAAAAVVGAYLLYRHSKKAG